MLKKTEKNLLQLRKNQVDEYIMSKRKVINLETYVYQINPLHLYLEEEKIIDIAVFIRLVSIQYFL
jgi:hypothetical protein